MEYTKLLMEKKDWKAWRRANTAGCTDGSIPMSCLNSDACTKRAVLNAVPMASFMFTGTNVPSEDVMRELSELLKRYGSTYDKTNGKASQTSVRNQIRSISPKSEAWPALAADMRAVCEKYAKQALGM